MAERKHPSRRPGFEPVPSSTTATSTLVDRLAAGAAAAEEAQDAPIEPRLARLAAVLGVDGDSHEVATAAVTGAADGACTDPDGEATLWGGSWDAVGFAGVALLSLLERIGRPARLGTDRLRGLTLQQQVLLLLVEVELVPPDEVAGFFDAPLTEVHDHLRRLHLNLQLPPPPESPCADWEDVRVHHRLADPEREDADAHLDACEACADAFDLLEERRGDLIRNVPGIGWTQLGRAFAELG